MAKNLYAILPGQYTIIYNFQRFVFSILNFGNNGLLLFLYIFCVFPNARESFWDRWENPEYSLLCLRGLISDVYFEMIHYFTIRFQLCRSSRKKSSRSSTQIRLANRHASMFFHRTSFYQKPGFTSQGNWCRSYTIPSEVNFY